MRQQALPGKQQIGAAFEEAREGASAAYAEARREAAADTPSGSVH